MATVTTAGVKCVAKRAKTFGSILPPSLFDSTIGTSPTPSWLRFQGSFRGGHIHCKACSYLLIQNSIRSYSTGKEHRIHSYIKCNSKNVVYVAGCSICRKQYVGHTTTPPPP
ncbi:hypothetical protein GDO81_017112 [Engystomops pustulosus]|uniref:Uncharacterized protein n=1 Tax=Engystomops pustulosus TaxID=76066 RepID=A0AAV7ACZ9_ENGPU|nr:hypothetical protein GDO81_017112 [Engystomops pustulosus]